MIIIQVNGISFYVNSSISVLEACKYIGVYVPRYCYHEILSVAGNCRMCLIEVGNSPKPMAACALPVLSNMKVYTDTPLVKKARENITEALLLNHPLDCPICDQGGECDLQDQSTRFGSDHSRFLFNKRGVEDKYCGPIIKTIMTRCIHCTRCVRFSVEIAGVDFFGTLNRGTSTEIGSYSQGIFYSELSGNVIDLCPVGALTSKPHTFKARPWELRNYESIDLNDGVGSNVLIHFKEAGIFRISPKINFEINGTIISDKARYSYDAHKNQRLTHPCAFETKIESRGKILKQDLNTTLSKISNIKQSTLILLNKESDNIVIALAKYLSQISSNSFKVKSMHTNLNSSNFVSSWNTDKISGLKALSRICFIISSDLRLESAVINAKLRAKYFNENCIFFSSLNNFSSTVPLQLLNLNLRILLNFFEAKLSLVSELFINHSTPIICIAENFFINGILEINFLKFFKFLNSSAVILNIRTFCNSSGTEFLNLKSVNTLDLNRAENILSINLSDNFFFNRMFNSFFSLNQKKEFICAVTNWKKSFGSGTYNNVAVFFPLLNELEEEQHYSNLEQRPQKTTFIFRSVGESYSAKSLLEILIDKFLFKKSLNMQKILAYYVFNVEMIKNTTLFTGLSPIFSTLLSDFDKGFSKTKVSLLNAKPFFTDFYLFGKTAKDSLLMSNFSQKFKLQNKVFLPAA